MTEFLPTPTSWSNGLRMCLSTFVPTLSRVRHWSCPEQFSSPDQEQEGICMSLQSQEVAEWPSSKSSRKLLVPACAAPVLAGWQERLKTFRQLRHDKSRRHHKTTPTEDLDLPSTKPLCRSWPDILDQPGTEREGRVMFSPEPPVHKTDCVSPFLNQSPADHVGVLSGATISHLMDHLSDPPVLTTTRSSDCPGPGKTKVCTGPNILGKTVIYQNILLSDLPSATPSGRFWWAWLLPFLALLLAGPALGQGRQDDQICLEDGIYNGDIEITMQDEDNDMSSLKRYVHCRVVEGSISITAAIFQKTDMNFSMPNLVEVTDYVAFYRADEIKTFRDIFPKLAVIRGNRLVQHYALAIYQMRSLLEVGLPSLTHIMKGGVKIAKNPKLCYVDTINWKSIVQQEYDREDNVQLSENQEKNSCPAACPKKCNLADQKCWNADQCQKILVPCPDGHARGRTNRYKGRKLCYLDSEGQPGQPCSQECVGGCSIMDNNDGCVACKHTRQADPQNEPYGFTCRQNCPPGFVAWDNWKCIDEQTCSRKQIPSIFDSIDEEELHYKVHGSNCVKKCPSGHKPTKSPSDSLYVCEECVDGPCPISCPGENINSRESAEKLKHCTEITGDLVITVIDANITPVLEDALSNIEEIAGSLKIERSHSLVSLHFFKKLKRIRGVGNDDNPNGKVLYIFENDNLQKLFPEKNEVQLGQKIVFIHYNQKLCKKEIDRFLDGAKVPGPEAGEYENERKEQFVSTVTNGNQIVCSEEKLWLNVEAGDLFFQVKHENYQRYLEVMGGIDINSLLGYHIYYRELTEKQFTNREISKFEGMEVCSGSAWTVMFQDNPSKFTRLVPFNKDTPAKDKICDVTEKCIPGVDNSTRWVGKIVYEPVTNYIPNLKPFTPYAVYVTTVMERQLAGNATGAQSNINYTRTLEAKPSPVQRLKADNYDPGDKQTNTLENKLRVSWSPPAFPNGLIEQYYVVISYLGNGLEVRRRNYCMNKKEEVEKEPDPSAAPKEDSPANSTLDTCPKCESCGAQEDETPQGPPSSNSVQAEQSFYNELINALFTVETTFSTGEEKIRRKREITSVSKNSNLVVVKEIPEVFEETAEDEEEDNGVFIQQPTDKDMVSTGHPPLRRLSTENRTMTVGGVHQVTTYANRTFITVTGNLTSLVIENLRHFDKYEVQVFACQKEQVRVDNGRRQNFRVCSDAAILNAKTKERKGVDNITQLREEEDLVTNSNNSVLAIKWKAPINPNGEIVSYFLSWAQSLADPNPFIRCIPLSDISELAEEPGVLQYNLTHEGEYYIRLRAVSLYSAGDWTSWKLVRVNSSRRWVVTLVIVICFLLLAGAIAMVGGLVYQKKRKERKTWEVSTHNENYIDTRDVYVVDDWEVRRELVTWEERLGEGSFGLVFKGSFNHPTKGILTCAVKTVNEQAGYRQRIEFLHEASAMKDFKTEHVVKLIGVVSQGQPTLVLMELMESGDLKNYLRTLRPDSENNRERLPAPTLQQVLHMALEISDGMAYLSDKKLVHRDLAARNCMVSINKVVKVGDFGMARDVYETEYYRKEGRGFLPVRWMAPESIRDGKFTSQSDVWSYGVVLWEMATLAEQPYQGFSNEEVMKYVKDGHKMARPEDCPDRLYILMSDCWDANPLGRPTFLDICAKLLPGASDKFHRTAFYTSEDGKEAILNQEALQQMRREQEEALLQNPLSPLTGPEQQHNGNGTSDNGHLPGGSGESHPMVSLRPNSRSPTQVQFSNDNSGSRSSKLSMNGLVGGIGGIAQRLRNKSGSTSGEA